ncbi:CBS domain-containing protein [Streptomyces sp. NPDC085639]|uniref:CBS domain-containing protein n=1 Tax=Streptomyces sp. NPDC085639 TaxID=3365734 RepID=UPI0037D64032
MHATRQAISDMMTHTAIAAGREASYKDMVELMLQWQVSALPVLEGAGHVVAVVSEADLLPKAEFRRDNPGFPGRLEEASKAGAVLTKELMSSPTVTVHPEIGPSERRSLRP